MPSNLDYFRSRHFSLLYTEWKKIKKISLIKKLCPVCNSNSYDIIFYKIKLRFCRCKKCNHIYINPFFKTVYLKKHFKYSKAWSLWNDKILLNNDIIKQDKIKFIEGIKLLKKRKKISNLLDIGCGSGIFLNECKNKNINGIGIELNSKAIDIAKKKFNLNVIQGNLNMIDNSNFYNKFDVVTLWSSLEYITEIKKSVKIIKKVLKKGSILLTFISGNPNSLFMRVGREKCVGFIFNRFNYFSPQSLNYLLTNKSSVSKGGFKLIHQSSYNENLNDIFKLLDYQDINNTVIKKNFFYDFFKKNNLFFRNFLLTKNYGYKFLSIYEKR